MMCSHYPRMSCCNDQSVGNHVRVVRPRKFQFYRIINKLTSVIIVGIVILAVPWSAVVLNKAAKTVVVIANQTALSF